MLAAAGIVLIRFCHETDMTLDVDRDLVLDLTALGGQGVPRRFIHACCGSCYRSLALFVTVSTQPSKAAIGSVAYIVSWRVTSVALTITR
jgi:hypothetical protein